ncbi:MAG: hypothetical protein ACE5IZ_10465, partial [Dehalococcoidia bacterium]
MNPQPSSQTQLRGRWLLIARVAWIVIAILTFVVLAAGKSDEIRESVREPLGVCAGTECGPWDFTAEDLRALRDLGSVGFFTTLSTAGDLLEATSWLVMFVIAGLIFWRRSDD